MTCRLDDLSGAFATLFTPPRVTAGRLRPFAAAVALASVAMIGPAGALPVIYEPAYDLNKILPTDSCLCWAAAASNILQYRGWGVDLDGNGTVELRQDIFEPIKAHFGDVGGFAGSAFGYYLSTYRSVGSLGSYFKQALHTPSMPASIDALLSRGYGVAAILRGTTGLGLSHEVTVWGVDRDPRSAAPLAVLITDSDDKLAGVQRYAISARPSAITPDGFFIDASWVLPGYYDVPRISNLEALGPRVPGPLAISQPLTSDVPYISDALAAYILEFYAAAVPETGITDAPIVGLNGTPLTAASTGQAGLRYEPGAGVGDQIVGNGIDELVAVSFAFPEFARVDRALLTLDLTPSSRLIDTDLLLFADNASTSADNWGNSIFATLADRVGEDVVVTFDLAAMPGAHGPVDLRDLVADGVLDLLLGDDAVVHAAILDIVGEIVATPIAEPGLAALFALAAAMLPAAWRGRPRRT